MQQFQGNDGNMYMAVSNGTGGVNYFRIHSGIGDASYQQPISREIFGSQTGADLGAIENSPEMKMPSIGSGGEYGGTPTQTTAPTSGGTSGGSTGGGTAPAGFVPTSFLGTTYNTEQDLLAAKQGYLQLINREKLNSLDKAITDSIGGKNVRSLDQAGGELGRQKKSLLDTFKEYMDQYNKDESGAMGNLSNYYSNLGDITQSSQGVREADTRGEFNTARGKLSTQKGENLSALDRSLQDYLYQDTQNRNQLATGYATSADDLINQTAEGLVSNQNVNPGALAYSGNSLTKGATNSNSSLLNALNSMRSNQPLRGFGSNPGKVDPSSILQYLYNY